MNYRKLDPGLALALSNTETSNEDVRAFDVFIRMAHAPDTKEVTYLEELGISCPAAGRQILTATLSARAVDELSKQPWVRYLELSNDLQLLG